MTHNGSVHNGQTPAETLTQIVAADGTTLGFVKDSDRATDAEARAKASTTAVLTPANLAGIASFKANKGGSDQTGVTAAQFTAVTFGTEVYDVGSLFASSAWTPPAGKVRLTAVVTFASVDDGACQCAIYKNGGLFINGSYAAQFSNAGRSVATGTDSANGTDVYTVQANAAATGTYDISGAITGTFFCGEQI